MFHILGKSNHFRTIYLRCSETKLSALPYLFTITGDIRYWTARGLYPACTRKACPKAWTSKLGPNTLPPRPPISCLLPLRLQLTQIFSLPHPFPPASLSLFITNFDSLLGPMMLQTAVVGTEGLRVETRRRRRAWGSPDWWRGRLVTAEAMVYGASRGEGGELNLAAPEQGSLAARVLRVWRVRVWWAWGYEGGGGDQFIRVFVESWFVRGQRRIAILLGVWKGEEVLHNVAHGESWPRVGQLPQQLGSSSVPTTHCQGKRKQREMTCREMYVWGKLKESRMANEFASKRICMAL